MKVVAIDLETIPNNELIDFLPDVLPSGNLKTPEQWNQTIADLQGQHRRALAAEKSVKAIETKIFKAKEDLMQSEKKISADIQFRTEKQLEEMGLNPLFNIICSAGWCDENGTGHIILKDENSEKDLLEEYWEWLSQYDLFVTFNGRNFDMRCLSLHDMRLGVRPSVDIDQGRYNRGNHVDLRPVLSGDKPFAKGDLNLYANIFLGDEKSEGIDGALVREYWAMGAKDIIGEYNEKDCDITYRLFKMAETAGLIQL